MAMLIQTLSAKLGIATGKNLAEHCREQFPRSVVLVMWGLMEIVAMATDLAEFLGAAIGFNLLLGIPLWVAGILTAICTFLILGFERYGFRPLEAIITALVSVIAVSYLVETILDRPDWGQVAYHSALTQGRIAVKDPEQQRRLFRFEILDVLIAMGLASLINMAMLIMAASTFFNKGMNHVATIQDAYQTLQPLLGPAAGAIFAISLLASGLSSSSVGTMAGQVIMQGFLERHIPVWIRRLVTVVPSLVVISLGLDPTRTLVISQVVLSFCLPFAVVPLVLFTRRKDIMGPLTNKRITTVIASLVAVLIIFLNMYLLYQTFTGG
jgi:manganese transport protein